jgi:glutamate 5-kinase
MTVRLATAKRVIVKIGSATLVDAKTGRLDQRWLATLSEDVAALKARGAEVLIVSSGAIALGRHALKLPLRRLRLDESQAAAAIGQIALAHAWQQTLGRHGMVAAQVLLTLSDTEARRRYLNARSTLAVLLKQGAVPVINENDTVATSEIRYGDNDRLAARVTGMISGDCLVLLSDVDGLYTAPPGTPGARLIQEIAEITPEIEAAACKPVSAMGSGGMVTKLEAAKIALAAGAHMAIASGRTPHPLRAIEAGAPCTWFVSSASPIAARKRWIGGTLLAQGRIGVDAGAAAALLKGKSLLPAGVRRIDGVFAKGDAVSVHAPDGAEIARGLIGYDRAETERIAGRNSREIETVLGYRGREELIHRDDLVLTGAER